MNKYVFSVLLGLCAFVTGANGADYYITDGSSDAAETVRTIKKTTAHKKVKKSGKKQKNTITNNFYYIQPASKQQTTPVYNKNVENKIYLVDEKKEYQEPVVMPSYVKREPRKYSLKQEVPTYKKRSYNNYTKVNNKSRENTNYDDGERKYYLAHPFFQPLKGKFGSITDVSYAQNSFKFDLLSADFFDMDPIADRDSESLGNVLNLSGRQETTQFLIKEDISFGITDTVAVLGMLQYDSTKVTFKDWSDDSMSDSGLNIFGLGVQYRFVDNSEYIGMLSGYFQHQKDVSNAFSIEAKAGYKIDRTTLYGLLRGTYTSLSEGDTYGALVTGSDGDLMMLSYKTDVKNATFLEGGVGAFSVLNKDFTVNGELVYGSYDWHNQLNMKAAFGYQPGDMFALNLYGSFVLFDSAKGQTKDFFNYDVNPDPDVLENDLNFNPDSKEVFVRGKYKIKDYNEWKIGLQAILYF